MKAYKKLIRYVSKVILIVFFSSLNSYALTPSTGEPVDTLSYPGIVRITLPNWYFLDLRVLQCTGIVLGPRRILTTSDCVSEQLLIPGLPVVDPVQAQFLRVHPAVDGEIGGLQTLPAVQQALMPNFQVTDVVIHPQNLISVANFYGIEYRLAILYLDRDIDVFPATVYDGQAEYTNAEANVLGWAEETRIENGITRYYNTLRKLSIQVSKSMNSKTGLYSNLTDTVTLTSADAAIPAYRSINGRNVLIGLNLGGGDFENVASMINFIKQHAPNTQFFNESNPIPASRRVEPGLWPLLLDD